MTLIPAYSTYLTLYIHCMIIFTVAAFAHHYISPSSIAPESISQCVNEWMNIVTEERVQIKTAANNLRWIILSRKMTMLLELWVAWTRKLDNPCPTSTGQHWCQWIQGQITLTREQAPCFQTMSIISLSTTIYRLPAAQISTVKTISFSRRAKSLIIYSDILILRLLLTFHNFKNTGVMYSKVKHIISTPDLLNLTYGLYLNVFEKRLYILKWINYNFPYLKGYIIKCRHAIFVKQI